MSIHSLLEDLLRCECCGLRECDGPDGFCEPCRLEAIKRSPVDVSKLLNFTNLTPEEAREWEWIEKRGNDL